MKLNRDSCRVGIWVLALTLVVSGCASPDSRIKQNPELFGSFPLEAQELIRKGQIDIGFEPEMVTMALGSPNRVYTRQTKGGTIEVWSYTAKTTTTDRQRVNANIRYRDNTGRYRTTSDWVWVDVARDNEYERIRIEFSEGKVSAIETLQR
ncbi:MAG TPA: hypothetical protein PJ991_02870 [Kiritimatiellia bacterium]|nr:hypothetical protein [Kiritimatiellia bacterium]